MCYEWEEELAWYDKEEKEKKVLKVPVDIGRIDITVEPPKIQEPAVPEAA